MLKIKSVYAKASNEDGRRILVDLFWPEGLKTQEAGVDEWLNELGPSYDLQRFHYDTSNWETYKSMYEKEVLDTAEKKTLLENISKQSKNSVVTLLYGSRDVQHNHASILRGLIENSPEDSLD